MKDKELNEELAIIKTSLKEIKEEIIKLEKNVNELIKFETFGQFNN